MQQNQSVLTEQEMITDALSTEKQIISAYGTFLSESTCENLRNELTSILNEKQHIQFQIFDTMKQKGWYNTKNANINDVQTAAQKYQSMQQNMQ